MCRTRNEQETAVLRDSLFLCQHYLLPAIAEPFKQLPQRRGLLILSAPLGRDLVFPMPGRDTHQTRSWVGHAGNRPQQQPLLCWVDHLPPTCGFNDYRAIRPHPIRPGQGGFAVQVHQSHRNQRGRTATLLQQVGGLAIAAGFVE